MIIIWAVEFPLRGGDDDDDVVEHRDQIVRIAFLYSSVFLHNFAVLWLCHKIRDKNVFENTLSAHDV